jgi:predicted HTH transcriptional regulator
LGGNTIDFVVKKFGYGRKLEVNVVEKIEYPELNQNQKRAMDLVKRTGKISARIYQEINKVGKNTAWWELTRMVDLGYLKRVGKKKGAYYILSEKERKKNSD